MKLIVTEKAKGKKFDKRRMRRYWERVFPRPYAKTLVGKKEDPAKEARGL